MVWTGSHRRSLGLSGARAVGAVGSSAVEFSFGGQACLYRHGDRFVCRSSSGGTEMGKSSGGLDAALFDATTGASGRGADRATAPRDSLRSSTQACGHGVGGPHARWLAGAIPRAGLGKTPEQARAGGLARI